MEQTQTPVASLIKAINNALMMPPAKKVPAKWEVVKISERHFVNENLEEAKFFLAHTDSLVGLYAFDSNFHAHIASFTPSYEMHRVGTDFSLNEAGGDLSDGDREKLHCFIDEGNFDDEPVCYMDVSSIERIRANNPERFKDIEVDADTLEADDPDTAAVDEIRERICTGSFHF